MRLFACVAAVCVSVSFGRGECATLSRVLSHVTYPTLRETGAAHLIPPEVPLPWVRCQQVSRDAALHLLPATVGSQIFRRTLCLKCIQEEKEG